MINEHERDQYQERGSLGPLAPARVLPLFEPSVAKDYARCVRDPEHGRGNVFALEYSPVPKWVVPRECDGGSAKHNSNPKRHPTQVSPILRDSTLTHHEPSRPTCEQKWEGNDVEIANSNRRFGLKTQAAVPLPGV